MGQRVKIGQTWCGKWSNKGIKVYDIYLDTFFKQNRVCYIGFDGGSYHMHLNDFLKRFNLLEDVEEKKENNMEFVKVDEVRVGQVWGVTHEGFYVEESDGVIKSIDAAGYAMFEDGREVNIGRLINDKTYVCIKDAGKSYNDPREELLKNVCEEHDVGGQILHHTDYRPSDNENNHDFSDILSSIGEMLAEKDKRYGNSALKPLDIFAKHHSYGARLDEKLSRVKNSDELRKNDVADIIGGLVLICRDNGWTDFSDQID